MPGGASHRLLRPPPCPVTCVSLGQRWRLQDETSNLKSVSSLSAVTVQDTGRDAPCLPREQVCLSLPGGTFTFSVYNNGASTKPLSRL